MVVALIVPWSKVCLPQIIQHVVDDAGFSKYACPSIDSSLVVLIRWCRFGMEDAGLA